MSVAYNELLHGRSADASIWSIVCLDVVSCAVGRFASASKQCAQSATKPAAIRRHRRRGVKASGTQLYRSDVQAVVVMATEMTRVPVAGLLLLVGQVSRITSTVSIDRRRVFDTPRSFISGSD